MTVYASDTVLSRQVREKLTALIEQRTAPLVRGSLKDYGEYQRHAGFIEGATAALRIIDETYRAVMRDQDGEAA